MTTSIPFIKHSQTLQGSAQEMPAAGSVVTPTLHCLGACPTIETPSAGTSNGGSSPSQSATAPCVKNNSITDQTNSKKSKPKSKPKKSKHKKHEGGISNLVKQLIELLEKLLQLLGGGKEINIGSTDPSFGTPQNPVVPTQSTNPTGSIDPTKSTNPTGSSNPCPPTSSPTSSTTAPQTSAAPSQGPPQGPKAPEAKSCKPKITYDTAAAPELDSWLRTFGGPHLEGWYAAVGDKLVDNGYTPLCEFTLKVDSTITVPGQADPPNKVLKVNPKFIKDNMDKNPAEAEGMLVHEGTHVLENYPPGNPGWVAEGLADYAREYIEKGRPPKPPKASETWTSGYSAAAYFISYVEKKYDPNFAKEINIAAHNGTYKDKVDTIWQEKTGKPIKELWDEMMATTTPRPEKE